MGEALDMAENIINFVSITCIQRYYFWYSYTNGSSGESLIWGVDNGTTLYFPKKYFVYKLFINASNTLKNGPVKVDSCEFPASIISVAGSSTHASSSEHEEIRAGNDFACIQFGNVDRVLVNKEFNSREILDKSECSSLCCTTETEDFICTSTNGTSPTVIPARSVCHCVQVREANSLASSTLSIRRYFCIYLSILVFVSLKF